MKCQGNGTTFNDNVKDFGKADNYIFYFPKYSSLVFFIIVTVSTPPVNVYCHPSPCILNCRVALPSISHWSNMK